MIKNGVWYIPFISYRLTQHCPEVILLTWKQAFNQDLKSMHPKCAFGPAQINNVQFQKISILPPQKGLEFPGGWGFL